MAHTWGSYLGQFEHAANSRAGKQYQVRVTSNIAAYDTDRTLRLARVVGHRAINTHGLACRDEGFGGERVGFAVHCSSTVICFSFFWMHNELACSVVDSTEAGRCASTF